ncbi:MAG: hypothetical protein ACRDHW_05485 [Ktedonobacteraceae bacterium]
MLQNTRAVADIPRLADGDSNDFFSQNETLKIVTCPICQAVYLPAFSQQEAAQSSFAILEAAFLRVCHFCFRCQRPACPQCWNPVHHVCTACGEEAHLPFLSPVPSLEGLVFAPSVFPLQAQTADLPLTCMRNGRFCLSKSVSPKHAQAANLLAASPRSEPPSPTELPGVQAGAISVLSSSAYPSWLQEMMGHQAEEQAAIYERHQPLASSHGNDEMRSLEGAWEASEVQAQVLEHSPARAGMQALSDTQENLETQLAEDSELSPACGETSPAFSDTTWPVWEQNVAPSSPQVGSFRESSGTLAEAITHAQRVSGGTTLIGWVENILIVIMTALLLSLILIIALAMKSTHMNALFFHLIHVDIRAEIAYLFQAI